MAIIERSNVHLYAYYRATNFPSICAERGEAKCLKGRYINSGYCNKARTKTSIDLP